jgi:hypothetical protein
MATRRLLEGKPTSFSEAFPGIGDFRIEIDQDHWGFHSMPEWRRKLIFTPDHPPPEEISCVNPRCQQGGLNLRSYIYDADQRAEAWVFEDTVSCPGHEGSPQGRRVGRPCDVAWQVKMEFRKP